jgi:hypothetical protein
VGDSLCPVSHRIRCRLSGGQLDIEVARALFKSDPLIESDAGGAYLAGTIIDAAEDDAPETATETLRRINGVCQLLCPVFKPLTLTGEYEGLEPKVRLRVLSVAVKTYDIASLDPAIAEAVLQLSAENATVQGVLQLLARLAQEPDWYDLYKVYELIYYDAGRSLVNTWGGLRRVRRFTESANRPEVSGDLARHAVLPGEPSGATMTLSEAVQLIHELVEAWIDCKLEAEQGGAAKPVE